MRACATRPFDPTPPSPYSADSEGLDDAGAPKTIRKTRGAAKKGRGKAAGHPHGNLTWARAGARGAVRPHGNLTWTRAESEARGAGSGSGSGSGSSGGGGGRGAQ